LKFELHVLEHNSTILYGQESETNWYSNKYDWSSGNYPYVCATNQFL